ncbi:E3 ubiquitin-protein ligase Hakai-like isoform X2 [Salvelinus namaycush]|uniref:E3 ubiquitin-protein ligase Hakai n=1 Tax=Salvelinus namaycush TaxID=8040 RepID=A0A8U1H9L9_SALNM|nr:E3 ubiquitin-protein ligase Hakai-like isoform X2 [Salvelinus namaycush]
MYQNDTDLQGTDGSGILGSPDVRRRIPIKLLSKQPVRSKAVNHSQRPLSRLPSKTQSNDEEGFGFKQEDRFERKSGDALGNQRRFSQPLFWDYKLNLVGEKDDTPVHFCEICGLPIKLYGRMIPCKHVFCYDCALLHEKKMEKMCPGCTDPVQRVEQCLRGLLYMCSIVPGCKRTYLSQRDLQAHVNHRHMRAAKAAGGGILPRLEPLHPQLASEPPDHHRRLPLPHLAKGPPTFIQATQYCPCSPKRLKAFIEFTSSCKCYICKTIFHHIRGELGQEIKGPRRVTFRAGDSFFGQSCKRVATQLLKGKLVLT